MLRALPVDGDYGVADRRNRDAVATYVIVGAVLGIAIVLVFAPVLGADFFIDDIVRLYDLANYGLGKLVLSPQGGHPLFVSNTLYALFRWVFHLEPSRWF